MDVTVGVDKVHGSMTILTIKATLHVSWRYYHDTECASQ